MPKAPKSKPRPWVVTKPVSNKSWSNPTFYASTAWRKLRKVQLQQFPLCKHCLDKNIIKAAKIADHKLPIEQGGEPLCLSNLQSLCESCHASKSASESHLHR